MGGLRWTLSDRLKPYTEVFRQNTIDISKDKIFKLYGFLNFPIMLVKK